MSTLLSCVIGFAVGFAVVVVIGAVLIIAACMLSSQISREDEER